MVLVLLLLAAGGYWWMFNQPSPDDKAQQITGSIEQTAIPTLTEPTLSPSESNLTSVTDGLPNDGDLSDATDDSNSLPPTVTEEVASVGNDDTSSVL